MEATIRPKASKSLRECRLSFTEVNLGTGKDCISQENGLSRTPIALC